MYRRLCTGVTSQIIDDDDDDDYRRTEDWVQVRHFTILTMMMITGAQKTEYR